MLNYQKVCTSVNEIAKLANITPILLQFMKLILQYSWGVLKHVKTNIPVTGGVTFVGYRML